MGPTAVETTRMPMALVPPWGQEHPKSGRELRLREKYGPCDGDSHER